MMRVRRRRYAAGSMRRIVARSARFKAMPVSDPRRGQCAVAAGGGKAAKASRPRSMVARSPIRAGRSQPVAQAAAWRSRQRASISGAL